jgi:hypothetical protein
MLNRTSLCVVLAERAIEAARFLLSELLVESQLAPAHLPGHPLGLGFNYVRM